MEAILAKYQEKTPAPANLLAQLPSLIDKKYLNFHIGYGMSSLILYLSMYSHLQ